MRMWDSSGDKVMRLGKSDTIQDQWGSWLGLGGGGGVTEVDRVKTLLNGRTASGQNLNNLL